MSLRSKFSVGFHYARCERVHKIQTESAVARIERKDAGASPGSVAGRACDVVAVLARGHVERVHKNDLHAPVPDTPALVREAARIDGKFGVGGEAQPQQRCLYASSIQMLATASSEAPRVCCRYGLPATSRERGAGRPRPELTWMPKLGLILVPSIGPSERTIGGSS